MWTVRGEVERSIRELGLAGELAPLPEGEAQHIYREMETRFADRSGSRWIWEHLRLPPTSRHFDDDRAFERLPMLVPQGPDDLVFFPGSDEDAPCAYRGKIDAIVRVLADCPSFEYFIVPSSLDWLLCENHHGVLMAIGEPVESRLRAT